ncbi:MAG: 30S ribosomal protein S20 [Kiritimatiellae bacterium]|nr:30S ribosomal protein S20 [Kiritimatiellia bacterium]
MPNIKSAAKRMRQSRKRQAVNKTVKSEIKHFRRKVVGTEPVTPETYSRYCSMLDKAAKRGVIKKNTAIRRKRRAASRMAAPKSAPAV